MTYAAVTGVGAYLPERVLTNGDLADMVDTSDEWIVSRTGIRERHIVADGQSTSDLAVEAGRAALADAGVAPAEVDLLVVGTGSPDPHHAVHRLSHARTNLGSPGGARRCHGGLHERSSLRSTTRRA